MSKKQERTAARVVDSGGMSVLSAKQIADRMESRRRAQADAAERLAERQKRR